MPGRESFTPIGQPLALAMIRRMVETGRVGGSYLFVGPPGVGKGMTARFFAMAVNCISGRTEPCGHCDACLKILKGTHPDILEMVPEAGKQGISIEQVRRLQETLAFGPYEGRRRVVIIDPAERLGLEAANALLLTLEAPPAHTLFILIASTPYALLETIRSRCQVIRFSPLSRESLREVLARLDRSLPPGDPALDLCQGSVARLLSLRDPESSEKFEDMDALLVAFLAGNGPRDLIETPKWAKERGAMEEFLGRALWMIRNVWVFMEVGKTGGGLSEKTAEEIAARLGPGAKKRFPDLVEHVFQAMEDVKNNAGPELIFNALRLEMEGLGG